MSETMKAFCRECEWEQEVRDDDGDDIVTLPRLCPKCRKDTLMMGLFDENGVIVGAGTEHAIRSFRAMAIRALQKGAS